MTVVHRTQQNLYNWKDAAVFHTYRILVEGSVFWTKNILEWIAHNRFENSSETLYSFLNETSDSSTMTELYLQ